MKRYNLPKGLIVNLALPDKKEPETEDFDRLLPMLLDKIDGLLVDPLFWGLNCNPADYYRLFFERCIENIPPDIPVFIVVTGFNEDETADIFRCVKKILNEIKEERPVYPVDLPLLYHSNRGLPDYYRNLLSSTDLPMIIMNDPGRIHSCRPFYRRKNLITGVLKKVAEIPNVCGLINASDLKRSLSYSRIIKDRSNFVIYDGKETTFLENPNKNGLVSVSANLFPSSWKLIVKSGPGLEDVAGTSDMLRKRWYAGHFLQQVVKELEGCAPFFVRYVLNYWGIFEDPPGYCPDIHFDEKALHFAKRHPEPDKIQTF